MYLKGSFRACPKTSEGAKVYVKQKADFEILLHSSTTSHSSNPPSLYSSMTPSIYSSITPSQGRLWGKIDDEAFMEMIDQEREEDM